jgi:hypothetical protein
MCPKDSRVFQKKSFSDWLLFFGIAKSFSLRLIGQGSVAEPVPLREKVACHSRLPLDLSFSTLSETGSARSRAGNSLSAALELVSNLGYQ